MEWLPRLATMNDVPALELLVPLSVKKLHAPYYSVDQINAALGPVFGVDRQLIADETYFVIEQGRQIVGCGGWSRRKSLFGSDLGRTFEDNYLIPDIDPARIRAFFVHPEFSRKGIGRAILRTCEKAVRQAGFHRIELVATLAGEPLYLSEGYEILERYDIPLSNGLGLPAVRMGKLLKKFE
ncbi:MAG: GNAT family N-acetyltransferase [Verrucomicrobiota bacterium]|nr:GNAT family N-acetyltransferase [Verrucomicrobiota bacterium]